MKRLVKAEFFNLLIDNSSVTNLKMQHAYEIFVIDVLTLNQTERKDKEVREYAKRRWNDSQELIDSIMGMSDEFKENLYSALVFEGMIFRAGAASLQYRFLADDWVTTIESDIYFNKSEKRFYCPASKIKHETIEIGGIKPYWVIPEYRTDALTETKTSYYLYLKCSKQLSTIDGRLTGEGSFFISDQKIKIDDQDGYYTFWVVKINSENEENDRSFTTMYGFSELLPGQLTVDTWRTADGLSYIKGLANVIKIGGLDWNETKKDTLTLQGIINAIGAILGGFTIDNDKLESLTKTGGVPHITLNGKTGEASITGRFETSKDGNKVALEPSTRSIRLLNANNVPICSIGFNYSEDHDLYDPRISLDRRSSTEVIPNLTIRSDIIEFTEGDVSGEGAHSRVRLTMDSLQIGSFLVERANTVNNPSDFTKMILEDIPTDSTMLNSYQVWVDENDNLKLYRKKES